MFGNPLLEHFVHTSLPTGTRRSKELKDFRAVPDANKLLCRGNLRTALTLTTLCSDRFSDRLVAAAFDSDSLSPLCLLLCRRRTTLPGSRFKHGIPFLRATWKFL